MVKQWLQGVFNNSELSERTIYSSNSLVNSGNRAFGYKTINRNIMLILTVLVLMKL
jgi:hypothetical protein